MGQPPGARKGLERKAHRICIGKSEDLQRKARFFCPVSGKKMRTDSDSEKLHAFAL
jgi:hypothetical protein